MKELLPENHTQGKSCIIYKLSHCPFFGRIVRCALRITQLAMGPAYCNAEAADSHTRHKRQCAHRRAWWLTRLAA